MTAPFVGRQAELALLRKRLDRVTADDAGVAGAMRGRQQAGSTVRRPP
jgi:hypothetical protein